MDFRQYIEDEYDTLMEPYLTKSSYHQELAAQNQLLKEIKDSISPKAQEQLNELVNRMSALHADVAVNSLIRGVELSKKIEGVKLSEDIER